MPTLPDASSLGRRPTPQPSLSIVSGVDDPRNQALQNVAQGIGDVGQAMLNRQDRQDELSYANAKSQFLQTKVQLDQQFKNDQDFATAPQRYQEAITKAQQDAANSIGSARYRSEFDNESGLHVRQGLASINEMAFKNKSDAEIGNTLNLVTTNREAAIKAPDDATRIGLLNASRESIYALAKNGYISDAKATELSKKTAQDYAEASINALPLDQQIKRLRDTTPGTAADFIPSDKRNEMLLRSQREYQAQQDRLRILANQERAQFREDLSYRVQDAQAAYLSGQDAPDAPTRVDFYKAFDPDHAERQWQNFQTIQNAGGAIKNLYTASPQERADILNQHTPVPGDGFAENEKMYSLLSEINSRITAQQKSDPAAYVAKYNPQIAQSFQAAMNGDSQAAKQYAIATVAEQKRLGITQPDILPKQIAAQIAAQFYDQKEGGQDSAKLMNSLQQQWGAIFPQIYQQLSEDDKLPAAAFVIPNMSDDGAKDRLARWSLVEDKTFESRLGDTKTKDIKTNLQQQLGSFWNSLSVQNGGEQIYNKFESQAYKLALGYVANGKSASDAATQAATEVINHNYSFGPTYRVPVAEIPDQVMQGVATTTEELSKLDIAPFPSRLGLNTEQAKKATLDIITHNPVWVTNGDESGLTLYAKGNNGLNMVRDSNGKPIQLTWEQLRARSAQKSAPSDMSAPGSSGAL